MLALIMPFLSSIGVSLFWKRFFLATWPISFSSLLQGSSRGRVVTLLINSGVISMERPLMVIVAWVLMWGTRERANSWAISSSNPWNFSKKFIQFSLVKMSTSWGCAWSLVELVGSFLINYPFILSILFFKTKYGGGDKEFWQNQRNKGDCGFLFLNKQNFFLCIFSSPKDLFRPHIETTSFIYWYSTGEMHETYLFKPKIVLKIMFSPFKPTHFPSYRSLLSLL